MGTTLALHDKAKSDRSFRPECENLLDRIIEVARRVAIKYNIDIYSRTNQQIIDASIVALSFSTAYLIHFGKYPSGPVLYQWLFWMPCLVACRLLVNSSTHVDRFVWRFFSLSDAKAIGYSNLIVTASLFVISRIYPPNLEFSNIFDVHLGIITLEFFFTLALMLSVRTLRRTLSERRKRLMSASQTRPKPLLLYGAGNAGVLLLEELRNRSDVDVRGFIDDDSRKIGRIISGVEVLGGGESLKQIVQRDGIREVIVSIASAGPGALANILAKCQQAKVSAKIVPTLNELAKQRIHISHVRDFRINELLDREIDDSELDRRVHQVYRGKRILVTGGGGSIGSELVRQLLRLEPSSLAILDKDENSVYELEQELKFRMPRAPIETFIADLRWPHRIRDIFASLKPDVVFHAAAHKHVPLMEQQPCEAVLNNVYGTLNILNSCCEFGIQRFVFISTDKAVNPTNIMGATKRAGEELVKDYARTKGLVAACVRFGNVMGSRGSVIPLFEKQIAMGGPITITHPEMVRFFMTIPEAVQLVLCAGSLANGGKVFVLDMGSPRKVLDLACQMVSLCGLEPGKDIAIRVTGLRPGEKLNEELVAPGENLLPTRFPRISMLSGPPNGLGLSQNISRLLEAAAQNNPAGVYETLLEMHFGYRPGPNRVKAAREMGSLPDTGKENSRQRNALLQAGD